MTVKNDDDLIYEVAAILGKKVAGEALSSEDYDTIKGCIDPVVDEIEDILIVNRDEIEGRYFQTLARLIAVHAAAKFSNSPVDLGVVQQHEQRLRYLVSGRPTYQPIKSEYF